jgi:hypothetical protein
LCYFIVVTNRKVYIAAVPIGGMEYTPKPLDAKPEGKREPDQKLEISESAFKEYEQYMQSLRDADPEFLDIIISTEGARAEFGREVW